MIRSKFTQDPPKVCAEKRTYLADDTLKDWMRVPEATSVFWATVMMPFIRKSTRSDCEARVKNPHVQIASDTEWLLRRMARTGAPPIPPIAHDVGQSYAVAPTPRDVSAFEIIVRETHAAALETDAHTRDLWSAVVGKLPRVPSKTGVRSPRSPHDRRPTKLHVLDAAIAQFPYLVNKIEGQSRLGEITHKYRFRQLYVDRYESVLSRIAVESEASEAEVFGAWADWGDSWSADREAILWRFTTPRRRDLVWRSPGSMRGCKHRRPQSIRLTRRRQTARPTRGIYHAPRKIRRIVYGRWE